MGSAIIACWLNLLAEPDAEPDCSTWYVTDRRT